MVNYFQKNTYLLSVILVTNEKFTFSTRASEKDFHLSEIQFIYNEFLVQKLKKILNHQKNGY